MLRTVLEEIFVVKKCLNWPLMIVHNVSLYAWLDHWKINISMSNSSTTVYTSLQIPQQMKQNDQVFANLYLCLTSSFTVCRQRQCNYIYWKQLCSRIYIYRVAHRATCRLHLSV